jgi:hypothetical protein
MAHAAGVALEGFTRSRGIRRSTGEVRLEVNLSFSLLAYGTAADGIAAGGEDFTPYLR